MTSYLQRVHRGAEFWDGNYIYKPIGMRRVATGQADAMAHGKYLPSLRMYADLLMPIDFPVDDSLINQFGLMSQFRPQMMGEDLPGRPSSGLPILGPTEHGVDLAIAVASSPDHYCFMPGPEFSPRLYRGQNQFFETCTPSIFRTKSHVEALYWTAKHIELATVMDRHPATSDLVNHQIAGLRFSLSIEAIAQHYQYPTQLMDFSRSRDVAMFFATCQYDQTSGLYSPLQSGTGVFYTVDLRELILQREGQSSFLPLGLNPLPRPAAQRAFALRLRPNENLNDMQWIQHQPIEITPALSQRYFEMFDGGKKLFPNNPFDDHIATLRTNRTLPLQALEFGLKQGLLPAHPGGVAGACHALRAAGYAVEDRAIDIDESMVLAAADEWAVRKADYFGRIRLRLAAGHISI
jgi:hypothetical protein